MMPSRHLLWLIVLSRQLDILGSRFLRFPPSLPNNSSSSNKAAAAVQQRERKKREQIRVTPGRVPSSDFLGDPPFSPLILRQNPSSPSNLPFNRPANPPSFRSDVKLDTQSRRRRRRRGEQLSRWPWRANFPPSFTLCAAAFFRLPLFLP